MNRQSKKGWALLERVHHFHEDKNNLEKIKHDITGVTFARNTTQREMIKTFLL